jgi:hypothetical protein
MIVDIEELTDFTSDHGLLAEIAVQKLICTNFELKPGVLTMGYNPEYDFGINNSLIELKFSRNNFQVTKVEVAREDKRPSGLSLTKSDVYAFFSQDSQTTAKLRLIRTADLYAYYLTKPTLAQQCFKTKGDHSGRIELPLNMSNLDNLGVGVCDYDGGLFYLDSFKPDPYAIDNIHKYIK